MKAIFSFLKNPNSLTNQILINEKNNRFRLEHHISFAALANYFAQKQGFETIFYGDEESLKDFKKIEFNHFERLPTKDIQYMPKCFWSISKLLAIKSIKEPCVHIDNDLFLTEPIPNSFLNNDIICFHNEKFVYKNYEILQEIFKIRPIETNGQDSTSYNCGIFGGQDIQTIQNSIDILFNFLSNNKDLLDLTYKNNLDVAEFKHFFYPSVLFEQVWLFQIMKNFNKKISELIIVKDWFDSFSTATLNSGYIHLMSEKSKFLDKIGAINYKKQIRY